MQRTCNPFAPRSSTQPPGVGWWGPVFRRASASASRRACAASVNGGIRPSGGSVTSDVRLVETADVPRSNQKLLYDPGAPSTPRSTLPVGSASVRRAGRASSSALRSRAARSRAAASSAVRNAWSARSSGRSIGVMVRKSQTPCRSGWPHGVAGASCAAAATGAARNARIVSVPASFRRAISTSPREPLSSASRLARTRTIAYAPPRLRRLRRGCNLQVSGGPLSGRGRSSR